MKNSVARMVTVVVTSAAMAVGGIGMATAAPADRGTGTASTKSVASTVEDLQHELSDAVAAKDVSAVTGVLDTVEETVTGIVNAKQFARAEKVQSDATHALDVTKELSTKLGKERLDPLSTLNGLVQTVLAALGALVDSLLGSVPVPELPVPVPVPDLPAPELPEVPAP